MNRREAIASSAAILGGALLLDTRNAKAAEESGSARGSGGGLHAGRHAERDDAPLAS